MMIHFKNGSRNRIFIFPEFLMKMLNYSILDHIVVKNESCESQSQDTKDIKVLTLSL